MIFAPSDFVWVKSRLQLVDAALASHYYGVPHVAQAWVCCHSISLALASSSYYPTLSTSEHGPSAAAFIEPIPFSPSPIAPHVSFLPETTHIGIPSKPILILYLSMSFTPTKSFYSFVSNIPHRSRLDHITFSVPENRIFSVTKCNFHSVLFISFTFCN